MAFVRTRIYYSIFTICGRPNGERRTWAFVVDRRCFSCAQQVKHCRQSDVIRVHCVYCITHIAPPKSSYPCDATTPFNSLYTWIVCEFCLPQQAFTWTPSTKSHASISLKAGVQMVSDIFAPHPRSQPKHVQYLFTCIHPESIQSRESFHGANSWHSHRNQKYQLDWQVTS